MYRGPIGDTPSPTNPDRRVFGWTTQHLFGLDFVADATVAEVNASLLLWRAEHPGSWRCVVTPNVDHLVRYERHPSERDVGRTAGIVLPDGMPIVWAGRLLRRPLRARLAGSDLFSDLWPRLVGAKVPTVVVASSHEVAQGLGAEHPRLRCVTPGFFDAGDAVAVTALVDEIAVACADLGAQFCIVGLSMPKHHLLAARLRERWTGGSGGSDGARSTDPPVVLLLGASPELYLGLTRRAPSWMQRSGLEWLFRFVQEPRRLAKRYFVDDVRFIRILVRERRESRR